MKPTPELVIAIKSGNFSTEDLLLLAASESQNESLKRFFEGVAITICKTKICLKTALEELSRK